MKIGILTFHRACNFGANLQAYSSSQYFTSLGHEVKVIDFIREGDLYYSKLVGEEQYECHQRFVENNLPLSREVKTSEELKTVAAEESFDMIVVGADAVWSVSKNYHVYFGSWIFGDSSLNNRIRVIALSPAIMGKGLKGISENIKSEIRNDLQHFYKITVRDEWTKQEINNELFSGEKFISIVNPDPVFFINNFVNDKDWDSRGLEKGRYIAMTLPKGWLQSRFLGKRHLKWFIDFKREANRCGYILVELPLPEGESGLPFDKTYTLPYDSIQWYLTLKNARAYCGLRFHAVVCCLAAGIPFYSMDTYCQRPTWMSLFDVIKLRNITLKYDKVSKIYNLLKGTGLEDLRNGGPIVFESAKKIVHRLLSLSREHINNVADRNRQIFAANISYLFQ